MECANHFAFHVIRHGRIQPLLIKEPNALALKLGLDHCFDLFVGGLFAGAGRQRLIQIANMHRRGYRIFLDILLAVNGEDSYGG